MNDENLEAVQPRIVGNMVWLGRYGLRYWKLVVFSLVVVIGMFVFSNFILPKLKQTSVSSPPQPVSSPPQPVSSPPKTDDTIEDILNRE